MKPSRDRLLSIARLAGDERGNEHERAVAYAMLEMYQARFPDLFVIEAPPLETPRKPGFSDIDLEPEGAFDPELEEFFRDWGMKAKGNAYKTLSDCRITIFPDKYRPGYFAWCVAWERVDKPIFSQAKFPSELAAQRDAWISEIAPARRMRRRA
jgi:hypothetical protein